MPVANCLVTDLNIPQKDLELMVKEWAELIPTNPEYITINLIPGAQQLGKKYKIIVNLYLPTIWSKEDIENIQLTLLKVLVNHTQINEKAVLIMTSLIQTEHVVDNGEIQKW